MKKKFIFCIMMISLIFLSACANNHKRPVLKGIFYDSQYKGAELKFNENYSTYTYYTKAGSMIMLTLKYETEGKEIILKWGNKAEKDFGFKPGDVVGIGEISDDNKTITIVDDKSGGFLYKSYGKDNEAAKAAKSEMQESAIAEEKWQTEIQTYIDNNIKVNDNSPFNFTLADYDQLVADNLYSTTKGKSGTKISEILEHYPNPNRASVGFSKNELILNYGNISEDKAYVMLTFVKQDDGTFTLIQKTEKGAN